MKNAGMLPSVSFYTVHTGITEVDLNVFVSSSKQWAVVCFRGTESETLRDWLSSILVTRPADFDTGQPGINATVRSTYYEQAISACDDVRHPLQPQPETGERTTMQLLKSLRRNYGCKIYFTGHSLGGGLCSLMGAYMAAQTPPIVPTAVITFGSPPVAGNTAFISWFSPTIPQKWRFVNGNEFAPMAPPLPFTTREQLLHVPKLIDVQNMSNPIPAVPGYPQMKERLSQLFLQHNLESLILDHNPVSTLRAIDDQIP
jgi:predicted lipase